LQTNASSDVAVRSSNESDRLNDSAKTKYVGGALKELLMLLGASVIGPAASTAEAQNLIAQCSPDVALVDFHLRGGEQSYSLVISLREQGVHVIMLSGSFESLAPAAGVTLLEKPISEALLLAHLSPIARKKAT
jgi:DNA-binding response OmpR family regulator